MKYLVLMVIGFAAFVAANEEWKPKTEFETKFQILSHCRKESGLTVEQRNNIERHSEYSDEKEVHAYVLCVLRQMGFFTDDKGFNVDRIIAHLDTMYEEAESVRDIIVSCLDNNEQKSTLAEWAYRGQQCIMLCNIGEILKKKN